MAPLLQCRLQQAILMLEIAAGEAMSVQLA